ncbi:polysaccharide deacetylase family protein [Flavobacterium sp.]|uniref:polysaccharide deacetylase family protein n=1 Tax=Flavobacterium sp. TaxID=239 RepID=UPI00261059B2|nr:polysaccharide deacetylase family protein [Flavobacterium sp.]
MEKHLPFMIQKTTLLLLLLATLTASAQSKELPWHNKKCAVVITYDDAIAQHLDNAIPVLDSLQLKATFYITANNTRSRIADWKKVAQSGHELGNHTLFHPCLGGEGREWVRPEYDLRTYSVQSVMDEISLANAFLEALDGKKERTFAFTCGDMTAGGVNFTDNLRKDFIAARAVRNEMHTIDKVDLFNIDCYVVNGENAAQMEQWVQQAIATHSLLVILFHGVEGGNGLNVKGKEHSAFLHYLKANEKDVWIAPMIDLAKFVRTYQAQQKQ